MTDKVGLKDSLHKVVIEGRYYGDKTFPSLNNYLAEKGESEYDKREWQDKSYKRLY